MIKKIFSLPFKEFFKFLVGINMIHINVLAVIVAVHKPSVEAVYLTLPLMFATYYTFRSIKFKN